MMHRNIVVLLLVGAIVLGWVAIELVVRGNEPQPEMSERPDILLQPDVLPQPHVQWEYKTICVPGPFANAAQTLNEYAKKGWEVVDWEDTGFLHFLLKREVSR